MRAFSLTTLVVACAISLACTGCSSAPAAQTASGGDGVDLVALKTEVARLSTAVPSQSHSMLDVGFHWNNLWFAAEKKNWPLAKFYFDEARQHILWTIRLRPIRKGPDGNPVDLGAIFEGIDSSTFRKIVMALGKEDSKAFEEAYKESLAACYGCHKSSGKPYLRPTMPTAPIPTIITFDPNATWPE